MAFWPLGREVVPVEVAEYRSAFTVPTTIGLEKATNPFLRGHTPGVQKAVGMEGASPVDVFTEVRKRKDNF